MFFVFASWVTKEMQPEVSAEVVSGSRHRRVSKSISKHVNVGSVGKVGPFMIDNIFCRLCSEEMSQWSHSLDTLLASKCKFKASRVCQSALCLSTCCPLLTPPVFLDGMKIFQAFLKSEFSDENIEFWLVCEDYKKIKSSFKMSCRAKMIFKRYIQAEAVREVGTATLCINIVLRL